MATICPCGCGRRLRGRTTKRAAQPTSVFLTYLPAIWRLAKVLENHSGNWDAPVMGLLLEGLSEVDSLFDLMHADADGDRVRLEPAVMEAPSFEVLLDWRSRAIEIPDVLMRRDFSWIQWWHAQGNPVANLHGCHGATPRSEWRTGEPWSSIAWDGATASTRIPPPHWPTIWVDP